MLVMGLDKGPIGVGSVASTKSIEMPDPRAFPEEGDRLGGSRCTATCNCDKLEHVEK